LSPVRKNLGELSSFGHKGSNSLKADYWHEKGYILALKCDQGTFSRKKFDFPIAFLSVVSLSITFHSSDACHFLVKTL